MFCTGQFLAFREVETYTPLSVLAVKFLPDFHNSYGVQVIAIYEWLVRVMGLDRKFLIFILTSEAESLSVTFQSLGSITYSCNQCHEGHVS